MDPELFQLFNLTAKNLQFDFASLPTSFLSHPYRLHSMQMAIGEQLCMLYFFTGQCIAGTVIGFYRWLAHPSFIHASIKPRQHRSVLFSSKIRGTSDGQESNQRIACLEGKSRISNLRVGWWVVVVVWGRKKRRKEEENTGMRSRRKE